MELEDLYKFNPPEKFLSDSEELPGRMFSMNREASARREIWIASRFCYGLNDLKNRNYLVRLVEGEEALFELKEKDETVIFRITEVDESAQAPDMRAPLKEKSVAVINEALWNEPGQAAQAPRSLLCFVNAFLENFTGKMTEEIGMDIKAKMSPFSQVWIMSKDTASEEKPFSIAKIYPGPEPLYLFEIQNFNPIQKILFRAILIFFMLTAFFFLWKFYGSITHLPDMWNAFDFFKTYRLNPTQ